MRDRAFRIYKKDLKVIKRIKNIGSNGVNIYYCGYLDVNNILHSSAILGDYIGSNINFKYKSHTTSTYTSKFKSKYSANRNTKWFDRNNNTRLVYKVETKFLIKEHYAEFNS
jgi:hypothetical protein